MNAVENSQCVFNKSVCKSFKFVKFVEIFISVVVLKSLKMFEMHIRSTQTEMEEEVAAGETVRGRYRVKLGASD